MPPLKLITKAQWEKFSPRSQGYLIYWQGNLPGSELKNLTCPYRNGSKEQQEFDAGQFTAMLDAQDSEE